MKVYVGADHRGFKLKGKIIEWLKEEKYEFSDYGAYKLDKDDDYTVFAKKVASVVSKEEGALGILLCGSGVGVDVTANKFDNVRASIGKESAQVKKGREDDDMNVLVIAADFTKESEALNMIKIFLTTKFSDNKKHKRRLKVIAEIEKTN